MPSCLLRPGFSFVEVLFAVIILGVGFIMIAAVFPVAIRQTKATSDETSAAAVARAGANCIAQYATNANLPSDGKIGWPGSMISFPMSGIPTNGIATTETNSFTLWQALRANVISQDDPRYAYVSMYFRGGDVNTAGTTFTPHPYAQIVTICVQATEAPTFGLSDYYYKNDNSINHRVNLQPRPIQVQIVNGANGDVDLIGIQDSAQDNFAGASAAAVEGAFVVIRTDTTNNGALIGNIYRLGARRADAEGQSVNSYKSDGTKVSVTLPPAPTGTVWELMPGNDFQPIAKNGTIPAIEAPAAASTEAWIVGRYMTFNAGTGTYSFSGSAMDVSAYSTFVSISQ